MPTFRSMASTSKTNDNDDNAQPPQSVETLLSQGKHFKEQRNWAEAEPLFQQALAQLWTPDASFSSSFLYLPKENDPLGTAVNTQQQALDILGELGDMLWNQGKLDQVETLFQDALSSSPPNITDRDIHRNWTHTCQSELAKTYMTLGRLDEAEPLMRTVLEEQRAHLGDQHLDTLESMNELGSFFLERHSEAEESASPEELLEGNGAAKGEAEAEAEGEQNQDDQNDSPKGYLDQAEPLLRESMSGLEALWEKQQQQVKQDDDDDDPRATSSKRSKPTLQRCQESLWSARNNWAMYVWKTGQAKEAIELMEKTLEGTRQALGDDHLSALSSMDNLASFYVSSPNTSQSTDKDNDKERMAPLDRAKPLIQKALEGKRRVLGDEHPSTLSTLNNFGSILFAKKQNPQALPFLLTALKGTARSFGETHHDTLLSMLNISIVYRTVGKYPEAGQMLERRFAGFVQRYGPGASETLLAQRAWALFCRDYLQNYDKAEELITEERVGWQALGNKEMADRAKTELKTTFQIKRKQQRSN